NPDRVKNKRRNKLTTIDHTPTPRGDKHLGVDYRGIHKNEKKKNQFEIRLREPPVIESGVDLEGAKPNDQEIEEVGVEINREGKEKQIVEEESNDEEEEENSNESDDEEDEANNEEDEEEEANDEEGDEEANGEEGEQNKGK
ncbi:hypothetical protein MKW98_031333, partial [Papaver atlanticum]